MIRKVNIRDLAGFVSKMPKERHAAAVRATRRTLRQRGCVVVREEINATQPHQPMDRGAYLRSWQVIDIQDGVRIFSTSPYASVIDHGRRPGFGVGRAGIEALMGWARRHGLGDRDQGKGAAFAIAASIKKGGLPAKHVFERAANRLIKECRTAVRQAISGVEVSS